MKDFNTLEKILYSHSSNNIIPGLDRIRRLLSRLGNPQDTFPAIHIVGTNGKGSTGAFISSIFQASGYKTGFYSSPHLESPGERLLINGSALSPEEWLNAANEVVRKILPDEDLPSYFELLTATAFFMARENNIDVGIIEAGLGGKLDATNLLGNLKCSVIASISIDHTEYLGNTLTSIAGEKFAVVRENVPACFSGVDESLIPMFKDFCRDNSAIPFVVSENVRLENVSVTPDGNTFDFYAPGLELKSVRTSLIGNYQVNNAALALSAVACVKGSFSKVTTSSILDGMLKASWPGRLEIVARNPVTILDGGHNYDGVKNLCKSVKTLWPDEKFSVVYAAMRDKNFMGCLELLSKNLKPAIYFTTVPGMQRALEPKELLSVAKSFSWQNSPEGFDEPTEAVRKASNDGNDIVLVCGSLYLIGYVRTKI